MLPMVLRQFKRHGQDARDGGFADSAVAAEDIAMRYPLLFERIAQSAGHMVLPDNIREALRTVFAG